MSQDKELIVKQTLYAGTKQVPFRDGTKVKFHYQTRKYNPEKTLLDDSKKIGNGAPMELVLGKKFKMEVWEAIIQKLALNEVAQFTVDKSLVSQYPFVSKTLRDVHLHKHEVTHSCALGIQQSGLGYEDLNLLMKEPCDLEFTLELIEVLQPEDYQKETWQMDEDERLERIPKLKELGNIEFKQKNYVKAAEHYAQAIGMLEQLQLKEKPHDTEWNTIAKQQVPYLLNFAQCKLYEGNFYAVIEHCTSVLKIDSDNVKALFRRAKAHVGAWNPDLAREDFNRALSLDPTLSSIIKKELTDLDDLVRGKETQDKQKFKNLFT